MDSTSSSLNRIEQLLTHYGIEPCADLIFLTRLALAVEERANHWQDRTFNSLQLALEMNQLAGSPVDNQQLAAATLAHDFGMGFIPIEVINKQGKLTSKERKSIQTHIKSAADLIHRLKIWAGAKDIILAHHEKVDGSGYPNQLTEYEICDGAKILAIVDAFTAQGKKQVMHGVMEISRHVDVQFSSNWVEHFAAAVKKIHQHRAQ